MRSRSRRSFLALTALALGLVMQAGGQVVPLGQAWAVTSPDEIMEDPELERRARALSKELRCLVCQNQSIDDSDADLARDLRRIVRERLLAGDSDEEIIDYVTERYGDFALLRPPMKLSTVLLWYGPIGLLVIAGGGMVHYFRRQKLAPPADPSKDQLSADEQAELERLLDRRMTKKQDD